MVLVGISLLFSNLKADEARTIPHKFRAFSSDTSVAQGATIYRITGYTTGANATFGVFNESTLAGDVTKCAIEGGEATSGDALPHYYFGEEGITLDTGMSVDVYNCTIVIEYI